MTQESEPPDRRLTPPTVRRGGRAVINIDGYVPYFLASINNPLSGVLNLSMVARRMLEQEELSDEQAEDLRRYLSRVWDESLAAYAAEISRRNQSR